MWFNRIGQKCTHQLKYLCLQLKYTFKAQVFFYSLEPEWAAAATEVKEQTKGKVKLAAVDATVNQVLASRYEVRVLPRLMSLWGALCFHLLHHLVLLGSLGRGRGEASRFVMMKLNRFTVVTSESGTQDCWGLFSFVCFVFSIALPMCLMWARAFAGYSYSFWSWFICSRAHRLC